MWVADSESSTLRQLNGDQVEAAIGKGLFSFGHTDGAADDALLQHPLGVTRMPDGVIAICDTYNGSVRHYGPTSRTVSTNAIGLSEPSGAFVLGDVLLVVESGAHRLTGVPLQKAGITPSAKEFTTSRTSADVAPGTLNLRVAFEVPDGQHLDDSDEPSTRLVIEATPVKLLRTGAGAGVDLTRPLEIADDVAAGVLHVTRPGCHL